MQYDERLDYLTQNAIKVIKNETPDEFHLNNLKYLSEQTGISLEDLQNKNAEEIRTIIDSIDKK